MRTILRRIAVMTLAVIAMTAGLPATQAGASPAVQYTNPIAQKRADPHIVKHTDGFYYFTATVPEYDRIVLRRATTIQGLATAPESVIWRRHSSGDMGAHIWAPEIHFINGKWYIYFAAGRTDDVWRIRMYVLENSSPNPLTGTWVERGRVTTPLDTFSLDASTFVAGGVRYLTWAQNDPAVGTGTNLYLARMGANPWTITGTVARLSVPSYAWETRGHRVNEGPSVIQRNGRIFLTYSASATDAN
jgi:GH43 family beta-xylosidase